MNITFVHFGRESLGIEYLSSVLKKAGHRVKLVIDPGIFSTEDNVLHIKILERFFNKEKEILKQVIDSNPDLVAFSVYTTTFQWACRMAKIIRQNLGVAVVFGGIHATLVPEVIIKNDFVDYVVVGEGEYPLLELVESLYSNKLKSKIKNLWYKRNNSVFINEIRSPISNLDQLPFPDKELFKDDFLLGNDYVILTSRGCVNNCAYCCESFLNKFYKGKYYRRRSIESVISELRYAKENYKCRRVMFFDSILFNDKDWFRDFLESYAAEIRLPYRCTGHVNFFNEEIGVKMKESGCYCIDFGVQTLNEYIRTCILNRHEKNSQIKKVFTICDNLKIRYDADFIFGLPEENEIDYLSAVNFFKNSKFLNRLKCFNLTYYPKLSITNIAKEKKILDNCDIEKINEGEIGDWFHTDYTKDSNKRRLHTNFKNFYKIFPLIPPSLIDFIVKKKIYKKFYLIPSFIIVIIQLIIGLRNRDYRFFIYIRNYLFQIKRDIVKKRSN